MFLNVRQLKKAGWSAVLPKVALPFLELTVNDPFQCFCCLHVCTLGCRWKVIRRLYGVIVFTKSKMAKRCIGDQAYLGQWECCVDERLCALWLLLQGAKLLWSDQDKYSSSVFCYVEQKSPYSPEWLCDLYVCVWVLSGHHSGQQTTEMTQSWEHTHSKHVRYWTCRKPFLGY